MMRCIWLMLVMLWAVPALAAEMPLPNPDDESRARYLFTQLRCIVCDGQVLAGSHAELSVAMRNEIRTRIAQGESDAVILASFAERYGEDILTHPPTHWHTAPLWIAPLLFAAIGFGIWMKRSKHH